MVADCSCMQHRLVDDHGPLFPWRLCNELLTNKQAGHREVVAGFVALQTCIYNSLCHFGTKHGKELRLTPPYTVAAVVYATRAWKTRAAPAEDNRGRTKNRPGGAARVDFKAWAIR